MLLARTAPALAALYVVAGCGCHGGAYALTARDQYRSGEVVVVRVHNETGHDMNVDVHMDLLRHDGNQWVSTRFPPNGEGLRTDMPRVVGVGSCESAVFKYHLGPELEGGQYRIVVDRFRTNTFEVRPSNREP